MAACYWIVSRGTLVVAWHLCITGKEVFPGSLWERCRSLGFEDLDFRPPWIMVNGCFTKVLRNHSCCIIYVQPIRFALSVYFATCMALLLFFLLLETKRMSIYPRANTWIPPERGSLEKLTYCREEDLEGSRCLLAFFLITFRSLLLRI